MLEIPWNHQWSYFIGLWVKFWRNSWDILAMHSQKPENCLFFLCFWCRTTPTLVIQCLFLSMVLWQEHLHQLFPSLTATLLRSSSTCTAGLLVPNTLFPLNVLTSICLGNFCLRPGGKYFKTQQRTNFSCWPQHFLQLHHFPDAWDLVTGEDASRLAFGQGPGCSAHFCHQSSPLPQAAQGVCYRCLSLCSCIWRRSQQPVAALGTYCTGMWTWPFSCIHFCTGIVENSGKALTFSCTWDQAHILGRASFFPYQGGWHLHELMVTESENLGRMRCQLTQAGDMCSPGHVNDGYFCGSCSPLLVCLFTKQTMYLLIFQPHIWSQLSFTMHLPSRF